MFARDEDERGSETWDTPKTQDSDAHLKEMEESAVLFEPHAGDPPAPAKGRSKRSELERLRRRLAEPCELKDRDLVTLLSYAIGGDGDPIVGLLDETRATISLLSEVTTAADPLLLLTLERRLSVALELYARATTGEG